ncbi:electron transfer flavoprotein subunit alpha/FixB family protein [bacterium]|nr:electron transfer flavoprotein subunit alpha/FixB family protein [bacterium]
MNVLVYVENRNGAVKKAGLEALSKGKALADAMGGQTAAVIIGVDVDQVVAEVKMHGADKIFVIKKDDLEHYQSAGHLASVVEAVAQFDSKLVMIAATSLGRDLAPRIAAKLGIMYFPDVTGAEFKDGDVVVKRPVYAGKIYMDFKAAKLPVVISTRPNVFDKVEIEGAGEVVELNPEYTLQTKVLDIIQSAAQKLDVSEADRIVAGGRGLKEPENFKLLENLADTLGAAVGASRAVVDAGWRPHSEQVGQTGKTVGPTLYIAVGISGAIQHLAGMRTSKVIVAINKDADAPIFKDADYGVIGDAMQIVPALNEALK